MQTINLEVEEDNNFPREREDVGKVKTDGYFVFLTTITDLYEFRSTVLKTVRYFRNFPGLKYTR